MLNRSIILSCLLLLSFLASSQIVGTDAFLQGNFVELGISNCGVFASGASPSTPGPVGIYHPTEPYLGFVADQEMNGWYTSDVQPNYCGDFFVPGAPVEGWAIQFGAGATFTNTEQYCSPNDIPGYISNYMDTSGFKSATWQGEFLMAPGATVTVSQRTVLPINGLYFTNDITICNLSSDTIFELYYMRNIDPDNEQPWTGDYVTANEIVAQFPIDTVSLVTARGLIHDCYLGIGSLDPRSRVTHGGFNTGSPHDVWNALPPFTDFGVDTNDAAISLAFRMDTILPGGCMNMEFALAFSPDELPDALATTLPNVADLLVDGAYFVGDAEIEICAGDTATIQLLGVDDAEISWSPSTSLSADTGHLVAASPAGTTTYYYGGLDVVTGDSIKGSVLVSVLPAPPVDAGVDVTIVLGDSVTLTATGAVDYSWDPAPGSGTSGASITVSPTMSTTYFVTGIDGNGCAAEDMVTVYVDVSSGLTSNQISPIVVYPNPLVSPNTLFIEHPHLKGEVNVQLMDALGVLVLERNATAEAGKLNLEIPAYANGIYHLLLVDKSGHAYGRSLVFK